MTIRRYIVGQFARPSGPLGYLAGRIMATRTSNIERGRWTVSLLDLRPGHRVLEIGYGPGLALQLVLSSVFDVEVHGIDHSPLMRRMAARRNRHAVAEGRLDLRRRSVADLRADNTRFDRIFCINTHMFWDEPQSVLSVLRQRLAPGGRLAITWQPRVPGATDETARNGAATIGAELRAAGFRVREEHELSGTPLTICVIGEAEDRGKH